MSNIVTNSQQKGLQRSNYHQNNNQNTQQYGYTITQQSVNLSSVDSAASEISEKQQNYKNLRKDSFSPYSKRSTNRKRKHSQQSRSPSWNSYSQSNSKLSSNQRTKSNNSKNSQNRNKSHQKKRKQSTKQLANIKIQNKICKYWKESKCNKPAECQFAHFKMGEIINEKSLTLNNYQEANQKVREGQILVKVSFYQFMGEEELTTLIKQNNEFMAREIAISYQNSKAFKTLKQNIAKTQRNQFMNKIEKKITTQNLARNQLYQLQANNNEMNAAQRQEAKLRRKIKREEKRVQNQLLKETQNLIYNNLNNQDQINQINSDEEIEENKSNNTTSNQISNKYIDVIKQYEQQQLIDDVSFDDQTSNNDKEQNQLKTQQLIEKYSTNIDPAITFKGFEEEYNESQPHPTGEQSEAQMSTGINANTDESQHNVGLNNTQYPKEAAQYIDTTQRLTQSNIKNFKSLNNLLTGEQILKRNTRQEHINILAQLSPTNKQQQNQTNRFQEQKFLKDLNKNNADIGVAANLNTELLDSNTLNSSEIKDYVVKQVADKNLHDWKYIYKSRLYYSSLTQNIFNLQELKKDQINHDQLICLYTDMSHNNLFNISPKIIQKVNQGRKSDEYIKRKPKEEILIIINQNIAEKVFINYTQEEITNFWKRITDPDPKDTSENELYPFIQIIHQILIHIIKDLYGIDLKISGQNYSSRGINDLAISMRTGNPYIFLLELLGDPNYSFITVNYKYIESIQSQ